MNRQEQKNKRKMYLTVGLIMVVIVTAWILNLKNSLNAPDNGASQDELQNLELDKKWDQMSTDLSRIFGNLKNLQESLAQSPTSTGTDLQGGPPISPEELTQVIQKLKIAGPTSTPTTTQELNSLP